MWFNKSIEETIQELNSNTLNGLTSIESKARLEKYGENKLISKPKQTIFQLFVSQLKDVMIYILIIAAIISAFL